MSLRRGTAVLGVLVVLLAGCGSADDAVPEPARPTWQAWVLPPPPGPTGRLMPRDVTACGGRWFVVGAVGGSDAATRPAAWSSADGRTWSPLSMRPTSYYGERAILYAVGCHEGRIAAIGAKAGGAHGNPRVRTWRQGPDGGLTEVSAEFELYGGPEAVSASRVAGGPDGWLIAGARSSGAAVWYSRDAGDFRLVDHAPGLASEATLATLATDAVAVTDGWLLAGAGRPAGRADRDPYVWFSPDGRVWTRIALPASPEDEIVQRLLQVGPVVYALGLRGSTFGTWVVDGARASTGPAAGEAVRREGWRSAGRFGATGSGAVAGVEAAAGAGGVVVAMTVGADGHRLWRLPEPGASWRSVALPVEVAAGGHTSASVAVGDARMVVTVDTGTGAGLWSAPLSVAG